MKTTDHSPDAELAVISAVLAQPGVFDEVASVIDPSDFYSEVNRTLWQAFSELSDLGVPQDVTTTIDHLRKKSLLKRVGGASAVSSIGDVFPDPSNARFYAEIIRNNATSRRLATMLREAAQRTDSIEAIEAIQTALDSIASKHVGDTGAPISEAARAVVDRAIAMAEKRITVQGVRTGFAEIDKLLVTLAPQQLYILAARPSLGKTALALNIASNVAVKQKKSVLFVSLEMGREELTQRVISQMVSVDTQRFLHGTFDLCSVPNDIERIEDAANILSTAPLYIDDRSIITTTELRTLARKVQAMQGLDLVIVDYLQLMTGPGSTPNEVYGMVSRNLKGIAKDLHVPVMALSQLSRNIEHEDRLERPRLADLRESGRIEQDADKVMFLVRNRESTPHIAQLQVAKNRQGPSGDIPLRFQQDFGSFTNGSWEDFITE